MKRMKQATVFEIQTAVVAGLDGDQASDFESIPLPPTVVEGNRQSNVDGESMWMDWYVDGVYLRN